MTFLYKIKLLQQSVDLGGLLGHKNSKMSILVLQGNKM